VILEPTTERRLEELRERLRRYLVHPRIRLDVSLAGDPLVFAQTSMNDRSGDPSSGFRGSTDASVLTGRRVE
jgi:hypothetical protein